MKDLKIHCNRFSILYHQLNRYMIYKCALFVCIPLSHLIFPFVQNSPNIPLPCKFAQLGNTPSPSPLLDKLLALFPMRMSFILLNHEKPLPFLPIVITYTSIPHQPPTNSLCFTPIHKVRGKEEDKKERKGKGKEKERKRKGKGKKKERKRKGKKTEIKRKGSGKERKQKGK